jgi:heterodisulfide reductase subunit A
VYLSAIAGLNIAGSVDTEEVRNTLRSCLRWLFRLETAYTCSDPGQQEVQKTIREHHVKPGRGGIMLPPGSMSPPSRTCISEAGLKPLFIDMASLREHCSWVHLHDREQATKKAKVFVKISVARAALLKPQNEIEIPVTDAALVIGGGVAGIQAALDLADSGHLVYLVEEQASIVGVMAALD